jgi:hypothetical protein
LSLSDAHKRRPFGRSPGCEGKVLGSYYQLHEIKTVVYLEELVFVNMFPLQY